ncbi:MAG: hypothetical protein ACYC0F_13660 [Rhodanobacter sp.]
MPAIILAGMGRAAAAKVSAIFISQEVNGRRGMLADMFSNQTRPDMLRMAIALQAVPGTKR